MDHGSEALNSKNDKGKLGRNQPVSHLFAFSVVCFVLLLYDYKRACLRVFTQHKGLCEKDAGSGRTHHH